MGANTGLLGSHNPNAGLGLMGDLFLLGAVAHFTALSFNRIPNRQAAWFIMNAKNISPLTWFGSTFAHGGWFHLLANLYCGYTFSRGELIHIKNYRLFLIIVASWTS